MKKRLELQDVYTHEEMTMDVLPNGTVVIHSAYFEKLIKFYPSISVDQLEACLIALGFTKED